MCIATPAGGGGVPEPGASRFRGDLPAARSAVTWALGVPSAHLSPLFKRRRRLPVKSFVLSAASLAPAACGNLLGREEAAGAGPPWAVTRVPSCGKGWRSGLRCARSAPPAAGGRPPGAGNGTTRGKHVSAFQRWPGRPGRCPFAAGVI